MLKISPENTYKLQQLLWIVLYWVTMIRIVFTLEYYDISGVSGTLFDPDLFPILRQNMLTATIAGLTIGLLTGLSELYIFQQYFQNKSFIRLILTKLGIYFICIFLITVVAGYVYLTLLRGDARLEAIQSVIDLLKTNGFYHLLVIGMLLSFGINFILIMQNKFGHGIFSAILLGKYFKPREEDRIFLFVDLKSSTKMAEQLGHVEYSQLLQQCFKDLSDLVIQYRGNIYQFVGDEVVITWKAKPRSNYANSIRLFFAFMDLLRSKSGFYRANFGVLPYFKGAINAGKVMVAEVGGSIKTEIAYHGDVLNTASRLMDMCNFYQKDLIVSESVSSKLEPGECDVEIRLQGEIQLRGKKRRMSIFSVSEKFKPKEIASKDQV